MVESGALASLLSVLLALTPWIVPKLEFVSVGALTMSGHTMLHG